MRKNQKQLEYIEKKVSQKLIERVVIDRVHSKQLVGQSENHLQSAEVSQAHDLEGAYALLYDAARKALSAILSIHGLRATSLGEHSILYEVLAQFYVDESQKLLRPFDRMRKMRNSVEYPSASKPGLTQEQVTQDLLISVGIVNWAKSLIN